MVKFFVVILIKRKQTPIIVFLNAHKRGAATWTINQYGKSKSGACW